MCKTQGAAISAETDTTKQLIYINGEEKGSKIDPRGTPSCNVTRDGVLFFFVVVFYDSNLL